MSGMLDQAEAVIAPGPDTKVGLVGPIFWSVISNLLFIALAVLVVSAATTRFETLVLAVLGMILEEVKWSSVTGNRMKISSDYQLRAMLIGLSKGLAIDGASESEQVLVDEAARFRRFVPVFYVNWGFRCLLYLFLAWKIVNAAVLHQG